MGQNTGGTESGKVVAATPSAPVAASDGANAAPFSIHELADQGIRFVIGLRKGKDTPSEVQSILFEKKEWTEEAARKWLKSHDYTAGKLDITGNMLRFRQTDPKKYDGGFRTIAPGLADGIDAVAGFSEGDFTPETFTLEERLIAVPQAIASYARKQARSNDRAVALSDLYFPFRDPATRAVNVFAMRAALADLNGFAPAEGEADLPDGVLADARTELAAAMEQYRAGFVELADSKLMIKGIPILTVGPTKQDRDITDEMFDQILASYDPRLHQAPVVLEPHSNRSAGMDGKAIAFVENLRKETIEGRKWIVADFLAASDDARAELDALLKGPMKFNSPELSKVRLEVYDKKTTKRWPIGSTYYLRRVNLLGDTPPAQFYMPQAAETGRRIEYSDNSEHLTLDDKGGAHMGKENTETTATAAAAQAGAASEGAVAGAAAGAAAAQKCTCGADLAGGKFCSNCGAAVVALADKGKTEKTEPSVVELSDQLAREKRSNLALSDQVKKLNERLDEQDKVNRHSRVADGINRGMENGFITPGMLVKGLAELSYDMADDRQDVIMLDDKGKPTGEKKDRFDVLMDVLEAAPVALSSAPLKVFGKGGGAHRPVAGTDGNDAVLAEYKKQVKEGSPDLKPHEILRAAIALAEDDPRWTNRRAQIGRARSAR